jgi:dipeptidyl-peptidase-4
MRIRRTALFLSIITVLLPAISHAGGPQEVGARLTVEAIYGENPLTGEDPSDFQWSPDNGMLSFLLEDEEETRLLAMDLDSGKPEKLAETLPSTGDSETDQALVTEIAAHHWSPDGRRLLAETGSGLFLLDLDTDRWRQLTSGEGAESNPQFSPDASLVAFVRDQDLHVIDLAGGGEQRLTRDGGGPVVNGAADWVHREELDLDSGFCWSPDSSRIAFYRFDQSEVRQWPIMNYGGEDPEVTRQYYPRPGEPNARVKVGVVDIAGGGTEWIDPGRGFEGDYYLARLGWMPGGKELALQRLSRDQRRLELLAADSGGAGTLELLLAETDPHWVNISDDLRFLKGGGFIWSSERDGWRHLYRYPAGDGPPVRLTGGHWQVDELAGLDEAAGYIYFTASEKSPLEQHLYRVQLDGKGLTRVTSAPGWHTITMSPDCRTYVDEHSSSHRPPRFTLHRADGTLRGIIHEGAGNDLRPFHLRPPNIVEVVAGDGTRLPAALLLPPGMSRSRRYPVVIYTYGGPHGQVVKNHWRSSTNLWLQLLAQRGFVVFWLDNRGAARRGAAWERAVDRRLGEQELEDQLCGVRYLRSLPYVDPERIGIFGWSYGGTMVLNAMLRSPGVFAAGAAVAPVTDWREYDTIYTERYMGLPAENQRGYKVTAPVNHADNLQGRLLLAHGTADDNVHFRNTAKMAAALNRAGKSYELAIYPGKGHSIRSEQVRTHIFQRLTRFFEEALEPERTEPGPGEDGQ